MKDNYPTRKNESGKFIERLTKTIYKTSDKLSYYSGDFYNENGFLVIKNFFLKKTISKCLVDSLDILKNKSGLSTMEPVLKTTRSVTGIHNINSFKEIIRNRSLKDIVTSFLGSDVYIHQSRVNYKTGIGSNGWHWHSDFETWHAQDGMPEMRCLTAMIPLTVNSESNGPLMVIPGSHKKFYSCKREKQASAQENFADQKEGIPDSDAIEQFFKDAGNKVEVIKCNPGDLVLFDCNIIHGSVQNMTPLPRTNFFVVFNSIENKLVHPFSCEKMRPEEMGARIIETI